MTDKDTITLPREVVEKARKALTPMAYHTPPYERGEIAEALRKALAAEQPKPEPVAVVGTQSNEIWKRVYENWVRMPLPEPAKMVHLLRDLPVGTPLYTAPPEDEALRRDAERYRWLRDNAAGFSGRTLDAITDAAIDAAMKEGT